MKDVNMIKTILFDLDGTLLPMDQEAFTKAYFSALAKKIAPFGYEPQSLVKGVWAGTEAMIRNDGAKLNDTVFWEVFSSLFGEKVYDDIPHFEEFYKTDFQSIRETCGFNPQIKELIRSLKERKFRLVVASNPVFPQIAQESRIRWSGAEPGDFEYITSYENSRFCKPNPKYYAEILQKCGLKAEECLMVGNDASEDMIASSVGIKVFLLTDCLINSKQKNIAEYPQGSLEQLKQYIESINNIS